MLIKPFFCEQSLKIDIYLSKQNKMNNSTMGETINLCYALEYIDEQLDTYIDEPQRLVGDMKDLVKIKNLAQSGYFQKIKALRTRNKEYEKALRGFDGNLLHDIYPTIVRSNAQFAYAIHSMTNRKSSYRKPVRNPILTQLKLKYFQSKGIVQTDWQDWYNAEEGLLSIKDINDIYEVKISVDMLPGKSSLSWKVIDVLVQGQHHQQLFYLFNDLLSYLSKDKPNLEDWQPLFILSIRKILFHMPAVMIFLNTAQKLGVKVIDQSFTGNFTTKEGEVINYSWQLDLFARLNQPNIRLKIKDQQVLCIKCKGKVFKAKMILGEEIRKINFRTNEQMYIDSSDMLISLPQKIYSLQTTIQKSVQIYETLRNIELNLFIFLLKVKWLPFNFQNVYLQSIKVLQQGIYVFAAIDDGLLIHIQQDLKISCWQLERGFFGCLLKRKDIVLNDLVEHMLLRKRIKDFNKDLEFKIYQIHLKDTETVGIHFLYEFKAFRFAESNRLFKLSKDEEELLCLNTDINDNFMIIIKIAVNFEKIFFYAHKIKNGSTQDSEINDQFLPQTWREYCKTVSKQTPPRYNYKDISQCIFYICRYYLVERTYHKRMTEDQRKRMVYHFT